MLDQFACEALLAPHFFFAHFEDVRTLAVMLKHLPLSLREAYAFCLAPCDPGDEPVAAALLALATWYSRRWARQDGIGRRPPGVVVHGCYTAVRHSVAQLLHLPVRLARLGRLSSCAACVLRDGTDPAPPFWAACSSRSPSHCATRPTGTAGGS